MRISDWSSDVCSSDLRPRDRGRRLRYQAVQLTRTDRAHPRASPTQLRGAPLRGTTTALLLRRMGDRPERPPAARPYGRARKSAVLGQRVSVRVDLGG